MSADPTCVSRQESGGPFCGGPARYTATLICTRCARQSGGPVCVVCAASLRAAAERRAPAGCGGCGVHSPGVIDLQLTTLACMPATR